MTKSMSRIQDAVLACTNEIAASNSQEVLDAGAALISAGLAYLDSVDSGREGPGLIDGEEAGALVHGLAWLFVDDLNTSEPFDKFCEALSGLLVHKAVGLSAAERSQITVRLAEMFGDVVTYVIASTVPVEPSDEELASRAKATTSHCISAALQQAMVVAMEAMEAQGGIAELN